MTSSSSSSLVLSDRIQKVLIDKLNQNQITIIIGPTGCGKSTLIPSFILDTFNQNNGKVLCSQPRRLAVVSLAKHVAKIRSNCQKKKNQSQTTNNNIENITTTSEIKTDNINNNNKSINNNDNYPTLIVKDDSKSVVDNQQHNYDNNNINILSTDVGYHVGQHNVSSLQRTKLLFVTAGILLQELLTNGVDYMNQYTCIILDECHERSIESDLCLVLIRYMIISNSNSIKTKIILMSATFDYDKYRKYFLKSNIDTMNNIDVISIETAESYEKFYNQVETYYFDDLFITKSSSKKYISNPDHHIKLLETMKRDPNIDLYNSYNNVSNTSNTISSNFDNYNYNGIMNNKNNKNKKNQEYKLSNDLIQLVGDLIQTLDQVEPYNAIFMIFAPTYHHLEQFYEYLQALQWLEKNHDSQNNVNNNDNYNGDKIQPTETPTKIRIRSLQLAVLHSSVDIEECLRNMKSVDNDVNSSIQYSSTNDCNNINNSKETTTKTAAVRTKRRILLASAIADSSITIPNVTCIIDTCRSLQVKWNSITKKHETKTIWSSQAICEQRKGRTGRTCPGKVFRLIPKQFYLSNLSSYEIPTIQVSDCRSEVLSFISSSSSLSSKSSNNNNGVNVRLLLETLDPPELNTVIDAIQYLTTLKGCVLKNSSGNNNKRLLLQYHYPNESSSQQSPIQIHQLNKYITTDYGALMAALPYQVNESQIFLRAAQYGYLYEMLLFQTIRTIRPYPIKSYFGNEVKTIKALKIYKHDVQWKDQFDVMIANMSAYMYWDVMWNTQRRYREYNKLDVYTNQKYNNRSNDNAHITESNIKSIFPMNDCQIYTWTIETEQQHHDWCIKHQINPTSVRAIEEMMDVTIKIMYHARFEPEWLRCTNAEPLWRNSKFLLSSSYHQIQQTKQMFHIIYGGKNDSIKFYKKLKDLYLASLAISNNDNVPNNLNNNNNSNSYNNFDHDDVENSDDNDNNHDEGNNNNEACIYHLKGYCQYGTSCRKSHSLAAKRPICRYYQSTGKCNNGDQCQYSHEVKNNLFLCNNNNNNNIGGVKVQHQYPTSDSLKPIAPILSNLILHDGPKGWYQNYSSSLLLLGEGNFRFTLSTSVLGFSPYMSTSIDDYTTSTSNNNNNENNNICKNLCNVTSSVIRGCIDATKIHTYTELIQNHPKMQCIAWNFPYATNVNDEDNCAIHEDLLLGTFMSLALYFIEKENNNNNNNNKQIINNINDDNTKATTNYYHHKTGGGDTRQHNYANNNNHHNKQSSSELNIIIPQFAITLQKDQLSRWNVLRSARLAGWTLKNWCIFNYEDFPGYKPCQENGIALHIKDARFYVFELSFLK